MLQFALRLGDDPRQVRDDDAAECGVLKTLLDKPSTVVTMRRPTANRPIWRAVVSGRGRGALCGHAAGAARAGRRAAGGCRGRALDDGRAGSARLEIAPAMERVVVAVDPPVTGHAGSDECGICGWGEHRGAAAGSGGRWCWRMHRSRPPRRTMGRGGDRGDGAARRRAAGGRGQSGRRSGRERCAPDRSAGAISERARSRGKAARAEPVAACTNRGGWRICAAWAIWRIRCADDDRRLSGQGQPGPRGRAGLGAERSDDRTGGEMASAADQSAVAAKDQDNGWWSARWT